MQISQTYYEHIERAIKNGWGWKPGMKPPWYYPGIDLCPLSLTSKQLPVVASRSGTVSKVEFGTTGYGVRVSIVHGGGYESIYAHLDSRKSKMLVGVGENVEQGQELSLMDNTGNSTGTHLHFEVRKDGFPIDPLPLLNAELTDAPPTLLGLAEVSTNVLNIRRTPIVSSDNLVGVLLEGTKVKIIATEVVDGNTWARIVIDGVYCAYIYRGDTLLRPSSDA